MIEKINPQAVGFSAQRLSRLDTVMHRYVDENKLAGAMTVVARKGRIAHWDTYGMADLEAGLPLQQDTIFRIYSMSKALTTTALLTLLEEGRLLLNDPVSRYIPGFNQMKVVSGGTPEAPKLVEQEREATIANLLTHTSGLLYGRTGKDAASKLQYEAINKLYMEKKQFTLSNWMDAVLTTPLAFQPGTAFAYGTSIDVVGRIIEVVSGKTLDVFMQERVFEPLGMVDTAFSVPEDKVARFAANYSPRQEGEGLICIDHPKESHFREPVSFFEGGGGLVSTAMDYLRFCQAILNGGELEGQRVLGSRTVELMESNHMPEGLWGDNRPGMGWGLSWSIYMDPGRLHELVSPGTCRWGGAASTEFWIDPREEVIGLVMTQLMPSGTYPLLQQAMTTVYQALE